MIAALTREDAGAVNEELIVVYADFCYPCSGTLVSSGSLGVLVCKFSAQKLDKSSLRTSG